MSVTKLLDIYDLLLTMIIQYTLLKGLKGYVKVTWRERAPVREKRDVSCASVGNGLCTELTVVTS